MTLILSVAQALEFVIGIMAIRRNNLKSVSVICSIALLSIALTMVPRF